MPGVFQMSIDEILKECEYLQKIGLNSIILFAIPDIKDSVGSECLCGESIISRTIKAIKEKFPQMFIVTDLLPRFSSRYLQNPCMYSKSMCLISAFIAEIPCISTRYAK